MKEDLWRIVDNQRIDTINFKKVVFNELSGCKTINILELNRIAREMERAYDYVLSYIYESLEIIYKEGIIKLEKNAMNLLCKKMKIIISEIEELKNEHELRLRLVHRRSE